MYVAALSVTMLAAKGGDANLVPVPPAATAGAQFPTPYPVRRGVSSNKDCALGCVACRAEAVHQHAVRIPASGVTYSSCAASLRSAWLLPTALESRLVCGGNRPWLWASVLVVCGAVSPLWVCGQADVPPALSVPAVLSLQSGTKQVHGQGASPWSSCPSLHCPGAMGWAGLGLLAPEEFSRGEGKKRPKMCGSFMTRPSNN